MPRRSPWAKAGHVLSIYIYIYKMTRPAFAWLRRGMRRSSLQLLMACHASQRGLEGLA